ncbi:hypothetical protein AgCh_036628 [Apium graveolens]
MVNETGDVLKTAVTDSGSGVIATIDWTTYRFPQPIDLSGDKHDEDKDDEATDPTDPTNPTEGSSKPGQKRKGTRKRRSKHGIHLMNF